MKPAHLIAVLDFELGSRVYVRGHRVHHGTAGLAATGAGVSIASRYPAIGVCVLAAGVYAIVTDWADRAQWLPDLLSGQTLTREVIARA